MTSSGKLPQTIQVGILPESKMNHKSRTNTTSRPTAEKADVTDTTATNTISITLGNKSQKTRCNQCVRSFLAEYFEGENHLEN